MVYDWDVVLGGLYCCVDVGFGVDEVGLVVDFDCCDVCFGGDVVDVVVVCCFCDVVGDVGVVCFV